MKPEAIVQHVKDYAKTLGGEFNLTRKGVPRIIMTGRDMKMSLVYAARSDVWKAFFPYPAKKQERKYFNTTNDLILFLTEKGCEIK